MSQEVNKIPEEVSAQKMARPNENAEVSATLGVSEVNSKDTKQEDPFANSPVLASQKSSPVQTKPETNVQTKDEKTPEGDSKKENSQETQQPTDKKNEPKKKKSSWWVWLIVVFAIVLAGGLIYYFFFL